MAATCAACLTAIPSGDKFVLSGTEVFHRRCAPNIARSVGTRAKLEIVRLKTEALRERQEAAQARIDAQNAENRLREVEANERRAREHALVENGHADPAPHGHAVGAHQHAGAADRRA